jgi:hypothetical protein
LRRECLAAIPDTSISGKRVVVSLCNKPGMVVSGNEFTSNAILGRAKDQVAEWHYIAPG